LHEKLLNVSFPLTIVGLGVIGTAYADVARQMNPAATAPPIERFIIRTS
jgi:hypothetical protein